MSDPIAPERILAVRAMLDREQISLDQLIRDHLILSDARTNLDGEISEIVSESHFAPLSSVLDHRVGGLLGLRGEVL